MTEIAKSLRHILSRSEAANKQTGELLVTIALRDWVFQDNAARLPGGDGENAPVRVRDKAVDFIEANLNAHLSVAGLAALFDMDANRFSVLFRAQTGSSPYKFIVTRRLLRAMTLLREDQMPLAEIAYDVGFSSQSHMTSVFRRLLNTTPGRFQR
ncbi:MAG: AraC family transcriptional regulator [Pseudomonadota bacterium]